MYKIVHINTFPNKATGSIMFSVHNELQKLDKWDSYVVWGRGRTPKDKVHEYNMQCGWEIMMHGVLSRIFDNTGFNSDYATERLLQKMEYLMPDIIQLHNLHGYYINVKMLFEWIKHRNIPVVWTLHDCWAFTGHCAYFDYANCNCWKNGCHDCVQKKSYPASLVFDNSKLNWLRKKELFNYKQLHLVTPSIWLHDLVKESFLKKLPCSVINNGIDTDVFKPSSINCHIGGKFKILGVASEWTPRKGLHDFIQLYRMLNHEQIEMTIVGLTSQQIEALPEGIRGMTRTDNIEQLVSLYQEADMFFNPTYEDNYPTTNLEALACGTPVCTYRTGGSIESVNEGNGFVVEKNELGEVKKIIEERLHSRKMGLHLDIDRKRISKEYMAEQYIKLYNDILL
ncbi:glycosyltransferase [Leyella stercorea]|jgi:putative colanic acid biosynthesis glycosyltransferase|uniref:glycosyltransferase n=2 Tax=Leyella stercorea TaxID=363265 RepID=UPI00242E34FE|nr:glycosyltransferase [Leyella stercorea]